MKKNYMQPEIMVMNIHTALSLLTGSGTLNLNNDSQDAVDADEVLSRQSGFNLWDDDEE